MIHWKFRNSVKYYLGLTLLIIWSCKQSSQLNSKSPTNWDIEPTQESSDLQSKTSKPLNPSNLPESATSQKEIPHVFSESLISPNDQPTPISKSPISQENQPTNDNPSVDSNPNSIVQVDTFQDLNVPSNGNESSLVISSTDPEQPSLNENVNTTDTSTDTSVQMYTVNVKVQGLAEKQKVVLQNNGTDDLTVKENEIYIPFSQLLPFSQGSLVTVALQPQGQFCEVTSNEMIGAQSVLYVLVTCANAYGVGGVLSGLQLDTELIIQNNSDNDLKLVKNQSFQFSKLISASRSYFVTILNQPSGQTCKIKNNEGMVENHAITNIHIECETGFHVGGTVSDLGDFQELVLLNNGGDMLTIGSDGVFSFSQLLANQTDYELTFYKQAFGKICQFFLQIDEQGEPQFALKYNGKINNQHVDNIKIQCQDAQ